MKIDYASARFQLAFAAANGADRRESRVLARRSDEVAQVSGQACIEAQVRADRFGRVVDAVDGAADLARGATGELERRGAKDKATVVGQFASAVGRLGLERVRDEMRKCAPEQGQEKLERAADAARARHRALLRG